ncbi:MAG: 4Fe-4S dicluster domain-containing protein [Desulfobacteraceae bacterium]|nr:4Fe-4S dicluster domain-containing protein [Desulfobacteraceae bacterium]
MSEAIICNGCNQNEAVEKCGVCGIDLCDMCKQIVQTEDISAAHRVQGMSTEGMLGPAQKKLTVCSKCMKEADFFEGDDHESVDEGPLEAVKDRLKNFKKPAKGEVTTMVGSYKVDLTDITSDIRGNESLVSDILRDDYIETRVKQYGTEIRPFPKAEEMSEWDNIILNRYRPLYTNPVTKKARGKMKLADDSAQALNTLEEHISATSKVMAAAREILDEAMKAFGPEKEIELGQSIAYPSTNISILTGSYPKNLGEMEDALKYGESQLIEQMSILTQKDGNPLDIEARALHLGSIFFLATEVEELVKICCFGCLSTGDMPVQDISNYPPAKTPVGLGTVDREKPVLAFFGDNFLPIFFTVGRLEEDELAGDIEITGFGNAGHELVRFYPSGKVLTSTGKAIKGIRSGVADLIVASDSCYHVDLIEQAKKAGVPVLVTGSRNPYRVKDLSGRTEKVIYNSLKKGDSVLVRSIDKAANVVTAFFKNFPGKMGKAPDINAVTNAKEKCTECDKCFHVCPNSLQISPALKGLEGSTPADLYDRCVFCGKCEDVCPEKIPVIDSILASSTKQITDDKFRMRPGRGPMSHLEFRDLTFGLVLGGNAPGMVVLLGCGHYPGADDELAYMAKELLARNCVVMTAGCAAADVSRIIDEKSGKAFPENYLSMATLTGLVNCGGCSADAHIMASMFKFASLGGGVSLKANYDQPADYSMNRAAFAVIIWGPASDKMMAKAAGYARVGAQVIVGPSGFDSSRMLVGNKHDRSSWTMLDGITGKKKEIDPAPLHSIIPVETKEEAMTMAMKLCVTPCALRDPRMSTIDNYVDIHEKYFDQLPDDWTYYVRSPLELHVMKRMRLLKVLRDEYGWEINRTEVTRVKDRSGNMVSLDEYLDNYGNKQGAYATMIERLVMRKAVKE